MSFSASDPCYFLKIIRSSYQRPIYVRIDDLDTTLENIIWEVITQLRDHNRSQEAQNLEYLFHHLSLQNDSICVEKTNTFRSLHIDKHTEIEYQILYIAEIGFFTRHRVSG